MCTSYVERRSVYIYVHVLEMCISSKLSASKYTDLPEFLLNSDHINTDKNLEHWKVGRLILVQCHTYIIIIIWSSSIKKFNTENGIIIFILKDRRTAWRHCKRNTAYAYWRSRATKRCGTNVPILYPASEIQCILLKITFY